MSKLLIIEDELLIAAMTENVAASFGYEVTGIAQNLEEAFLHIQEANFDIAAVDINLGSGLDGLEAGKALHAKGIPFFYLTSYESGDIIRKASETNPGTYLIKPFNPAQLLAALEVSLRKAVRPNREMVVLQDGSVRHQIYLDDILYAQSDNVHVDVHTKHQRITLRTSLKNLREHLPEDLFLQPHRSYLVNMANISRVSSSQIWCGKDIIPIARSYKLEVTERMQNAELYRN